MSPPTRRCRPAHPGGYTLVELFFTIGLLMCVLGLVMNLANRVRQESIDRKGRHQLQLLTAAVTHYAAEHGGALPDATPLIDLSEPLPVVPAGVTTDPAALQARAARNAADVRRALRLPPAPNPADDPLTDPWGTPIVFMPRQSPAIGMAPGDQFFFVSAGPDRRFLTRADNLYSYDYADMGTVTAGPATGPTTSTAP